MAGGLYLWSDIPMIGGIYNTISYTGMYYKAYLWYMYTESDVYKTVPLYLSYMLLLFKYTLIMNCISNSNLKSVGVVDK